MDLYSGLPYWIAKNPIYSYFNPLKESTKAEIVIIGSGITGALVAHELCHAGFKCTMIDKRTTSTGSSIASTALLQYEIDTPLSELTDIHGEDLAVKAYKACLQSITDLEDVFKTIDYNPEFVRVPSLFYASNRKGHKIVKKELKIRKKHGLPVEYLDEKEIKKIYGFDAPGALINHESAQVDVYSAATHIINYYRVRNKLTLFTNTNIKEYTETPNGYQLLTEDGYKIDCDYVVIAAGFEAGFFLPEKIMSLTSTYAIISQPVEENQLWKDRCLIWETAEPYLYIRTDCTNRIIVGGEDEDFRDPVTRDSLLRKKVSKLEKKFRKLFPEISFITEMAWCGTFSTTKDGLPFIGNWPGKDRMFYALGYGGNGITFSMIAAQVIKNKLKGIPDEREEVFGFKRLSK